MTDDLQERINEAREEFFLEAREEFDKDGDERWKEFINSVEVQDMWREAEEEAWQDELRRIEEEWRDKLNELEV